MGGQSFKCPYCDRWTLSVPSLRDHLRDKHGMRNAELKIEGWKIQAITFDYCGVRCIEVTS